jgi:hypothetical protein
MRRVSAEMPVRWMVNNVVVLIILCVIVTNMTIGVTCFDPMNHTKLSVIRVQAWHWSPVANIGAEDIDARHGSLYGAPELLL